MNNSNTDKVTANKKLNEALNHNRNVERAGVDEFERDIAQATGLPSRDTSTQSALASVQSITDESDSGYTSLKLILELAYDQAATGKGKERHATGPIGTRRWDKQPILEIGRMVGPGYAAGQVAKKVQEAVTMAGNGRYEAAEREALGAIVYAAALYKLLTEMDLERNN